MYGQNLGVRTNAPGKPIFTKFCVLDCVPDVFFIFEFQKDRKKNVGAVGGGGRNFPFLLEKVHCLYRTSRDCRYSDGDLDQGRSLSNSANGNHGLCGISDVHIICMCEK